MTMNEYMPQGYPMYAGVNADGSGGYVAMVVGWRIEEGGVGLPVVATVNGQCRTLIALASVAYLGPDLRLAREAAGLREPLGTRHDAPQGERYARGAKALCGALDGHDAHLWTPAGHDYPIACPGIAEPPA